MLSWTISRRSVVQRWPAVPAAENRIARSASFRSADGATIIALLPPSSSSERPKRCATRGPTARPIAVEPVAESKRDRADRRPALRRPRGRPGRIGAGPSGASPNRSSARSASAITASALSGVFSLGFQITGSPQTSASAAFHAHTATGKLKALMTQHRPQRVPLLDHPVVGPLAGDGQAIELARQADGEVADVDHLLDLAEAFLDDLAGLQRHQPGKRLLGGAQFLAEQPDQLAAPRRRDRAPLEERVCGMRAGRRDIIGRRRTRPIRSAARRSARG